MPSIREINEVVSAQMEKLENNRYENLDKKPKPINTII